MTVFTRHLLTPHYVPELNIHSYKRHLALLWVSVMYTLTHFSITLVGLVPRSNVTLLLGFSAMLRVSLVSRVTGLLLEVCTILCLGVYRHLVGGHEISRLQQCLECIMLVTRA